MPFPVEVAAGNQTDPITAKERLPVARTVKDKGRIAGARRYGRHGCPSASRCQQDAKKAGYKLMQFHISNSSFVAAERLIERLIAGLGVHGVMHGDIAHAKLKGCPPARIAIIA